MIEENLVKGMSIMRNFFMGLVVGVVIVGFSTNAFAAIGDKVEAIFAEYNILVDGEAQTLEATPVVINDSTYVPLRAMANMLGKDVTYKADSRTIELNTPMVIASKREVQPDVIDFSKHEPVLIEGIIRSLEADLKRYPEKKEYYEEQIAAGNSYLAGIGDFNQDKETTSIDNEIQSLDLLIESTEKHIRVLEELIETTPNESDKDMIVILKSVVAEHQKKKAELEARK